MKIYRKYWWKVLAVGLMFYTLIGGFLFKVPRLAILNETIRNQHFHVAMWFSMILLLSVSLYHAIAYLRKGNLKNDILSSQFAYVGTLFGMMGITTGSIWARFSWGAWWVNDPKLNSAAICLLIYLAYTVLRGSLEGQVQRARISSIYNIFAFAAMIPLLFVLPRLTDSLHPGSGGNPGFNIYDLDSRLRIVFYPAVIGWTLMGAWIGSLRARLEYFRYKKEL